MLLVAVVLAMAGVLAFARGGRLGRFALVPWRRLHLLRTAVTLYLLGVFLAALWVPAHALLLAATAACAAVFVWFNRGVPGLPLVGVGLAANALVVVANGAMPVSVAAAERAGLGVSALDLGEDSRHEPADGGTRLDWLADVVPFALPGAPQVVSVGDVAVAAGAGLAVYAGLTGRPRVRRTRPPRSSHSSVRDRTRASDSMTLGSYS